ncbi:hypothetical protein ACHAXN_005232 [Cyclotella atomus]
MSTDGSCPHHPAIRLRRYNRRTAEWKTLLETCPLCASGLPPSNSDGGGISNYEDDEATVSSRYSTSRHCDTDRDDRRDGSNIRGGGGSIADESAATTTSNYSATTMSNYSAATTQTGTSTVNTDVTYNSFGEGKSWSSMSTRKRGNGNYNISSYTSGDRENSGGGGYHYSGDNERNRERYKEEEEERQYTDDEGYKTEDTDENEALDSSMRSGMSSNKGVRFGPGTKEASEAGTDLESEAGDDNNYDYIKDSIHSNCDDDLDEHIDKIDLNASYNSNDELNDYMRHGGIVDHNNNNNTRGGISSQYSNTPIVKNPMPSALKPSTMGISSLVVYDGGNSNSNCNTSNNNHNSRQSVVDRGHSDHLNSSLTSLNDEPSQHHTRQQHQQQHGEKHKYRPPPPPRRDDDSLNGMDLVPANSTATARSTSRSRNNERSASRSRDVRPAPPQLAPSQPRSSSRARGNSSRGRDSSRSKPREGDNSSSSRPAPPPGRARSQSRSRQPSRSRGVREDNRSQPPPQQRPTPPVGILRKGIHSSGSSSSNLYNPKEAKDDDDDSYRNNNEPPYNDHHSRPGPPPRSAGIPMSPPVNNRMRMEPPETPPEDIDNYSLNSRDAPRRHTVGPHPSRRGPPPQDHQRRLTDQSGHHPTMNRGVMHQPPRSGPVFMHGGEDASLNSYEKLPPPPNNRGMQSPDHFETKNSNSTPKKSNNNRRNEQSGLTESETNISDTPSANADPNDSEAPVMAQASEYDDKGRCVKHPHIKLRKKKMLGGWKVMLVNCPDCCIEEMLKMRRNGPGRAGQVDPKSKKKRSPSEDSHSSGANPPISQLTIRNKDNDDDRSSSSGSASEITYGTKTDYSRSSAMGSWQQYGGPGANSNNPSADNSGTSGSGPHRVTRMPFTDAYGHKGWYTGEVASGSGLPHGKGTMHYCDGRMRGGLWSNGLVAAGGGGGGGGDRGNHSGRMGKGPSSGDSVGSHHSQHSRRSRNPPPSGGRENVVVGMEWMDHDGKDGFFTGETDEKGRPHGMGSMRYNDGKVLEGDWFHGEFDRPGRGDGSVKTSRSRNRGF